jgi:4-alpha-glucanotransferase
MTVRLVRKGDHWPPVRAAGILLHPTSLPGGRLGPEALAFVDWLAAAGQSFWQVLPLTPPDESGSPYSSTSAFAGSGALLFDPEARVDPSELRAFRRENGYWIESWVDHTGAPADQVVAEQVRFRREWSAVRRHAHRRGIRIIGDLPISVSRASDAVAAHPDLFDLSRQAGAPPDAFSDDGQLWTIPPFRWGVLRRAGYRFWIERLRHTLSLVDVVRLDHFRGFVAGWTASADAATARSGRWQRGPGAALFAAAGAALGPLPLIAEDLGRITPPVDRLREQIGALGLHVLAFGFDTQRSSHHPGRHRERAVLHTGTHDNDPVLGWWEGLSPPGRSRVDRALAARAIAAEDIPSALIELAYASRARVTVIQAQDILGLGAEGRMNRPGTTRGNWGWRLEKEQLDVGHAAVLSQLAARYGRQPPTR